jgi:hypothetical protein
VSSHQIFLKYAESGIGYDGLISFSGNDFILPVIPVHGPWQ